MPMQLDIKEGFNYEITPKNPNIPNIKAELIKIFSEVEKDIKNSLNHIVDGGFILLHDCNPVSYEAQLIPRQTIAWNGDVWKAFVDFKIISINFKFISGIFNIKIKSLSVSISSL